MDNNRENRIFVAQQNRQIVRQGYYELDGEKVYLLPIPEDAQNASDATQDADRVAATRRLISQAQVFYPDDLAALGEEPGTLRGARFSGEGRSELTLNCLDTYAAAQDLPGRTVVLNFANAHKPGGGYLGGASAQEESLCRCSTLYASLTSTPARAYYAYNKAKFRPTDTDAMILSRNVCVFRNADTLELLPEPYLVSVITAAAPDRAGDAAGVSAEELYDVFKRRICHITNLAALYGYDNLVLGAWGCGAFGNDPEMVANAFYRVLLDWDKLYLFERVVLAIKGDESSANYRAFDDRFEAYMLYRPDLMHDEPLPYTPFAYPTPALTGKMLNLTYAKITTIDDETGESTSLIVTEDKNVVQGLLPDGRPFLAHLWKDPENPPSASVDFVFSPADIPIDEAANFVKDETCEQYEKVEQVAYGIAESGETEFIPGDDSEVLGMVRYLKECGMVEFIGKYENGYAAAFEDAAGEAMQLVRIMLVDEQGEIVAKTPITF